MLQNIRHSYICCSLVDIMKFNLLRSSNPLQFVQISPKFIYFPFLSSPLLFLLALVWWLPIILFSSSVSYLHPSFFSHSGWRGWGGRGKREPSLCKAQGCPPSSSSSSFTPQVAGMIFSEHVSALAVVDMIGYILFSYPVETISLLKAVF